MARVGVVLDNIDQDPAKEKNQRVINVVESAINVVAEHLCLVVKKQHRYETDY